MCLTRQHPGIQRFVKSRAGFTVPYENVKGRAMFVWLSWNSCGEWWPLQKVRFERVGEGVR